MKCDETTIMFDVMCGSSSPSVSEAVAAQRIQQSYLIESPKQRFRWCWFLDRPTNKNSLYTYIYIYIHRVIACSIMCRQIRPHKQFCLFWSLMLHPTDLLYVLQSTASTWSKSAMLRTSQVQQFTCSMCDE